MKYTRITAASLAIALMTLAGCTSDANKTDSTALKSDSALAANLALANADSASKVSLGDTAKSSTTKAPPTVTKAAPRPQTKTPVKTATTPAPVKTTPAAPAAARVGTVAAGTTISLASNSEICTNTNAIGDNVTAETTEAISGTNGAAIPAGAKVHMTVTNLKRSENANDKIIMEFRVNSIEWGGKTHAVEASVADADVEKVRDQPKNKDVQKVAIGAAAGAVAGKILGKSTKATVIGGAAGAAAGAATAAATANYQGCIRQGARITVRLDAPLQLTVGL